MKLVLMANHLPNISLLSLISSNKDDDAKACQSMDEFKEQKGRPLERTESNI